ncbi:MAG TPA: cytochrome c oxidase assembly protein, partial [Candidatus Sulfotelmatobacter sp.]|nr:cytochrome c oxidase assembly protein [Candidatus Sulfotelmatobacter sp.]
MTENLEQRPARPMYSDRNLRRRNAVVLGAIAVVLGIMITLVSYSVTIYRLFCAATGYGGTTVRVAEDSSKQAARAITVRFDTSIVPGMPWRFVPAQKQVTIHLGEQALVYFDATNLADHAIVGHATYNVTPDVVGRYFKKIQCF